MVVEPAQGQWIKVRSVRFDCESLGDKKRVEAHEWKTEWKIEDEVEKKLWKIFVGRSLTRKFHEKVILSHVTIKNIGDSIDRNQFQVSGAGRHTTQYRVEKFRNEASAEGKGFGKLSIFPVIWMARQRVRYALDESKSAGCAIEGSFSPDDLVARASQQQRSLQPP